MDSSCLLSLLYHNFFDYPLTKTELHQWQVSSRLRFSFRSPLFYQSASGYYFLKGRRSLPNLRRRRQSYSRPKLVMAKRAANLLRHLPSVKLLAITGSLAMNNCQCSSDIDLLIITQKGTLWLTRFVTYLLFFLARLPVRQPDRLAQKDKLCLNIWLDESDLFISSHNLYTAHELAQIKPLLNRGETYQSLLSENKWILRFWPHAVNISHPSRIKNNASRNILNFIIQPIEFFSYRLQLLYMHNKRTTELITPTRAFFHRTDWSHKIAQYLKKSGVSLSSFSS